MTQEFKTTYLYIKTHNTTGLKYFGQTTAKDPIKYKGSGTYWLRHIKKHGNHVSTEIIGTFADKIWCTIYALEFSERNNIVTSSEWANLKTESLDGGFSFIDSSGKYNTEIYEKARDIRRLAQSGIEFDKVARDKVARDKGLQTMKDKQLGYMNPEHRSRGVDSALSKDSREKRLSTFKEISHQSGDKNSMFGTMWITNGISSKRINKSEQIPDEWYKGRVQ